LPHDISLDSLCRFALCPISPTRRLRRASEPAEHQRRIKVIEVGVNVALSRGGWWIFAQRHS
jgi:hypothetical protein